MRILLLTVALGIAAAGCGDRAPSCAELADHVTALASARGRAGQNAVEAAPRDELLRNCQRDEGHNAKMRACVMKATTLDAAKGCELAAAMEQLSHEQNK